MAGAYERHKAKLTYKLLCTIALLCSSALVCKAHMLAGGHEAAKEGIIEVHVLYVLSKSKPCRCG